MQHIKFAPSPNQMHPGGPHLSVFTFHLYITVIAFFRHEENHILPASFIYKW